MFVSNKELILPHPPPCCSSLRANVVSSAFGSAASAIGAKSSTSKSLNVIQLTLLLFVDVASLEGWVRGGGGGARRNALGISFSAARGRDAAESSEIDAYVYRQEFSGAIRASLHPPVSH